MTRRVDREVIFSALYDLVRTVVPPAGLDWRNVSRRFTMYDQVPPAMQPSLIMIAGNQTAAQPSAYGAQTWKWEVELWIYFQIDTCPAGTEPDVVINQFLDGFEKTLLPVPGDNQTLGGLVPQVFIDGTVTFAEVDVNQGVVFVPLSIITGM